MQGNSDNGDDGCSHLFSLVTIDEDNYTVMVPEENVGAFRALYDEKMERDILNSSESTTSFYISDSSLPPLQLEAEVYVCLDVSHCGDDNPSIDYSVFDSLSDLKENSCVSEDYLCFRRFYDDLMGTLNGESSGLSNKPLVDMDYL